MAARIGWRLEDPQTSDIYLFPVNPHTDSGSHTIAKSVRYAVQAGIHQTGSGFDEISTIVSPGGVDMERISYDGKVYTQDQLNTLEVWCNKDYPIEIEDDLLRRYLILVDNFTPTRIRSNQSRWKHGYQFTAIVLEKL